MFNFIYQVIRTSRPRQWFKNLSLFAAPVFSGLLFTGDTFTLTLKAFFVFCLLSSGVYFVNDIVDAPKDKLHPIKKNRPIASGRLSTGAAKIVALLLILGSLTYGYLCVGRFFTFMAVIYLLIQFLYSAYFRNAIILDSLVVASGFVVRVFAGSFASNTSISSWLALTTIGISLLLAFGKRRSEKTILAKYSVPPETRKTLRHYPDTLLDSMISLSATYAMITYSIFAFEVSPQGAGRAISEFLPSVLKSPRLIMITIPVVLYGVARYLYVIYEKGEAESPERVLLSDKPLLATVFIWGFSVLLIIYAIPLLS